MMMRRLSSLVLLILLALMTSACGKSGKVYPLNMDDTRSMLTSRSDLDILVLPGKILTLNSSESTENLLVWDVHQAGQPLFRFKASLSPENALSTRVALSLEAGPSSKQSEIQQRLKDKPTIHKLYLAAMDEAVSARLERRDFDFTAIYAETAAAAAANINEIEDQMRASMEKSSSASDHSAADARRASDAAFSDRYYAGTIAEDNARSRYLNEAQLEKNSAPSVDLSRY